jgi:transcriptional regulator with XRE-family HTH domain
MKEQSEQKAFYEALGANIRKRRTELKLSQDALARSVGLTRTSLTNIENGRQHPPLFTFCEILDQMKIDASALLPRRSATRETNANAVKAIIAEQTRTPDENAFITAALGLRKQEMADGDTKEEDRVAGRGTSAGERSPAGSRTGHQNRQGKRRANRRRLP